MAEMESLKSSKTSIASNPEKTPTSQEVLDALSELNTNKDKVADIIDAPNAPNYAELKQRFPGITSEGVRGLAFLRMEKQKE